jgi:DNA polymerase I-like protein with 3'-5' exonuclease and polymerase domains|tara:strand:- start:102 stop:1994 length:1893 start_codon:yes stop_codon:yes gene_type:complete
MKFLNYIEKQFEKVLAVDTEFIFDTTKTIPEKVICFCYTDIFSGEVFRFWEYDKKSYQRHFDFDKVLLVSYNATAEFGCFLKQLYGRPQNMWDAYIETARLYKPLRSGKGMMKLLSTAKNYGITDRISEADKEENLDLILRRNKFEGLPFEYTQEEQKQILEYCQSDTEVLRQVFIKQVEDIEDKCNLKTEEQFETELWQILNRGYAIGCVSLVERNGIPVDVSLINRFNETWPKVKNILIEKFNKEINVFNEDLTFSHAKFDEMIKRNNLDRKWPRMKSGHFTTNKKYIKQNLHIDDLNKFNEIRTFQNMTKLTSYTPGLDGRCRTSFNMFGTITGRASPSSAKYPFSASKWARNFIKPSFGNWLVYIDYSSQEPGVMGYLSKDQNLINAYQSGDIYIHTAKLFNMVPENATAKTHPLERKIFKVLYLANSYGQGPNAVSEELTAKLGRPISVGHAKHLQNKYKETYKKYFKWNAGFIEAGLNKNYLTTCFGWQRHIKNLFQFKDGKKIDIRRSLMNWPIQSHGAEILRKALIDLTDENFEVVALVHDAVLLQIPIPEFNQRLAEAKQVMVNASIEVVGGPIRVDHEVIKSNYVQEEEHQKLFDDIMNEINTYTRTRPNIHPDRVHQPI